MFFMGEVPLYVHRKFETSCANLPDRAATRRECSLAIHSVDEGVSNTPGNQGLRDQVCTSYKVEISEIHLFLYYSQD